MPVLRLFAAAREAAGVARAELDGSTVGAILEQAEHRYGERFSGVLAQSRVWVNGQPAEANTVVHGHDVIAVLPPVSGGSDVEQAWGAKAQTVEPAAEDATVAVGLLDRPEAPAAPGPEPEWLAHDPEPETFADLAGTEPPADDCGWSGWSSATGSYDPLSTGPPAQDTASGLFSPAAPPPPPAPPAPPNPPSPAVADPLLVAPATVASLDLSGPPAPPLAEPAGPAEPPVGGMRPGIIRLAVVYDSKGPHGRLGLLWAIVTVGAAAAGAEYLAAWLGLTVFVGACQASGTRLGPGHRLLTGTSALIAVALPAAAVLGVETVAAAVGGAVVVAFVAALFFSRGSATRDGATILAIGVALGLAAAAPVLLREDHIEAAFLLLAYAATYDAGAYLVGTGASSVWEGPVAGVAALIPVVILSAVLLVPPFQPGTPIALGLLAAMLAPAGPLVGSALVGNGEAHAPGLRRMDSLIVLGPIWSAAAVVFVN